MSDGRMQKTEADLVATVQAWRQQAAALDALEDAEVGRDRRGDELPEWVANKQARLEKIRQAKAALEAAARTEAAATRQTLTRGRPRTFSSEGPQIEPSAIVRIPRAGS